MKAATTTIINLAMGMCIIHLLAAFLAFAPDPAQAQDSGILEPADKYGREELTQMLAPVALYPDAILSQVLMASTYPIEVIDMGRDFLTRYRRLRLEEGAYEGQIKWLQLSAMDATKRRLQTLLEGVDTGSGRPVRRF